MSTRTRPSLAVDLPDMQLPPPAVSDADTPTVSTPLLRRTRSQAQREAQQQQQARSSPSPSPSPSPSASPTTPGGRRVRTRAWVAAAAATGQPVSPLMSPASSGSPSAAFSSPSLRARTMAREALEGIKHQLDDAGHAIKQSCTRYQLLAFEHVPEWLKDNRYIRSGYRSNIGWRHAAESVWTHIVAFLLVSILLVLTMSALSPHGVDRLDLDVVLATSNPQQQQQQQWVPCTAHSEGAEADQECVDGMRAVPGSVPPPTLPSGVGVNDSGVGSGSEDPLAVLHRLLGDSEEEMLVELVSRVQPLLPNLQSLARTLRDKATSLQDRLLAAMPERARQFGAEGRDSLSAYLTRVEGSLAQLKDKAAELLSTTPGTQAHAAGEAVRAEYVKAREAMRELLAEFGRDFSPDLLMRPLAGAGAAADAKDGSGDDSKDRPLDLVALTRSMLARFVAQAQTDARDRFEPALQHLPGVQVEVRVKPSINLGAPDLFWMDGGETAAAVAAANALRGAEAAIQGTMPAASDSSSLTRIDEDGLGKTVSTSFGYLSVALHTRSSQPGSLSLQLHSYLPRTPIAVFLITAMLCLLFSSAYHLLLAVSDQWARRFQALDYAGIVLLIAGSASPIIYYGFFCAPWHRYIYTTCLWALGALVFTIVVLPMYNHARYRVLKTVCFVLMGFSGVIPLMHFQWHLGHMHFVTAWLLLMGACYLGGAAIYVTQVPERWAPGYFDYFGSSHQLWHLSIFAAVIFHYCGLIHMYEWRMSRVCTADMYS